MLKPIKSNRKRLIKLTNITLRNHMDSKRKESGTSTAYHLLLCMDHPFCEFTLIQNVLIGNIIHFSKFQNKTTVMVSKDLRQKHVAFNLRHRHIESVKQCDRKSYLLSISMVLLSHSGNAFLCRKK